jgi:hypothetical protein
MSATLNRRAGQDGVFSCFDTNHASFSDAEPRADDDDSRQEPIDESDRAAIEIESAQRMQWIRAEIAAGRYLTPERIDAALRIALIDLK